MNLDTSEIPLQKILEGNVSIFSKSLLSVLITDNKNSSYSNLKSLALDISVGHFAFWLCILQYHVSTSMAENLYIEAPYSSIWTSHVNNLTQLHEAFKQMYSP